MKNKLFALSLLFAAVGQSQSLESKNVGVTILGADGTVVQKIKGKSVSGTFSDPIFNDGVIEFVQSPDAKISNGAKLYFQEAIFHRVTKIIEGSGSIRFVSPEVQLSADGYFYDLESGKLTLKANVVLLRSNIRVVSSNGRATIKRDEAGKWMIQDADLLGGVQSFGIEFLGQKFDKVENDHAHYDGIKEEVIFSSPIKSWSEGKERDSIIGELLRIDLKKDPNKAIQPMPTAVISSPVQEPPQN